ncbi:hypothetical protein PMAYCL1PPCAC_13661, partial [Pristionchus mayeri]
LSLSLFCAMFGTTIAAKNCHVYPTTGNGPSTVLDCTSVPGHSVENSGCFYRRYTDDSDVKAGEVEGGCGVRMCRGGKENCRFLMESDDGPMATSNFCCCYGEDSLAKAENVGPHAMF